MSGMPPEIRSGLIAIEADASLVAVVKQVAAERAVTADAEGLKNVGIRPAAYGAIATYVNPRYLDIRLDVARARAVSTTRGWKLIKPNGTSGIVHVSSILLHDDETAAYVVQLVLEALDKSAVGPPFHSAENSPAADDVVAEQCPTHFVAMQGGSCDQCE